MADRFHEHQAIALAAAIPPDIVICDYRLREAQASGVPLLHKPVAPEQLYRAMVGLLEKVE